MKKILLLITVLGLSITLHAQKDKFKPFIVANAMLSIPDTVNFRYQERGDTTIIHGIIKMSGMSREEISSLKVQRKWGKKYVGGKKLFDGKTLVYQMGDYKFLKRNDSLFQIKKFTYLSQDSIQKLMLNDIDAKDFDKEKLIKNLHIIRENQKEIAQLIYHKGMFAKGTTHSMAHDKACHNEIHLDKQWEANGTKYYALKVDYRCLPYAKPQHYIINSNFEVLAFKEKYVSKELNNSVNVRPYSQRYKFKE